MSSPTPLLIDGEIRFIARQPILDRKQQIYGYELLFRSGASVPPSPTDSETATRATLNLHSCSAPTHLPTANLRSSTAAVRRYCRES